MRLFAALALLLALAASQTKAEARDGWVELFDGRSLAGWTMTGPGGFRVERGALVSRGGLGLLWYNRRRFRDFELVVDWRVAKRCDNSGIFVRFPRAPGSPWDAVSSGYEVQIDDCDPRGLKHRTGAIYDQGAATSIASRPAGQWNRYHIRVVGQRYTVKLNGRVVTRFDGSRASAGYIGVQNHDAGSRVSYRSVRVRPIG